jgi:hypothetical protein
VTAPTLSPEALATRGRNRRLLVRVGGGAAVAAGVLGVFATRGPTVFPPLDAASPAPGGALGLFEAAGRLGWAPRREELPLDAPPAAATTYAALRAPHGVREHDAGRLLAAVRAGAGLVVDVRPDGDPLSDSLGLVLAAGRTWALDNTALADAAGARAALDRPGCDRRIVDASDGAEHVTYALADSGPARAGTPGLRVFVTGRDATPRDPAAPLGPTRAAARQRPVTRDPAPVLVGFPLGRGRVVAVADGALFTNAVLRTCWAAAGPSVVRALEWVSPATGAAGGGGAAPRGAFVFLQGRRAGGTTGDGAPSTLGATWRALTGVPLGRATAQALGAALVLLAALGARALPPLPSGTVQRRSPREHVGALARAYREARATRLVAGRLARGLRRRYGGAAARAAPARPASAADPDAAFLAAVAARHPAGAADAARLAEAARAPVPPAGLAAVGEAAARLDALLDAARRGA